MATETAITRKSRKTTLALIAQTVRGTFQDPGTDYMAVSNLSLRINTIEVPNLEYTGTLEGNAPDVSRGAVELSFSVNMRGPGGADVPAAGAYLPGRILVAAKMAEIRVTAAVPAAPEAVSAGTTTGFTGGAGMAAVADQYRGLAFDLSARGAKPKSLVGVRSNTAGKLVRMARAFPSALTGTWQLPKQLAYQSTLSSIDPMPVSTKVWIDGVRYDLVDLAISSLSIPVSTSGRDQGSIPVMTVTFRGRLHDYADQATPVVPSLGATPQFKDGQQYLADKYAAGTGFTLESGAQSEAAPDPNSPDGSGTEELVSLSRSISVPIWGYSKADFDTIALADGQERHAYFAQYGKFSGQAPVITVADARFGYSGPDLGGNNVTETPQLYIEALDKNVTISWPYWV